MLISIDKDIPAPIPGTKISKYPFRQMEVGDSFAVPEGVERNTIQTAATWAGKRQGKKFSVGQHNGGYRCWRVA